MTTPAQAAFSSGQGYGYYPRTMIDLCNASYLPAGSVAAATSQAGWNVVWGPAELVADGQSYALAYIARRAKTAAGADEFTLVVRGTNFESLKTWLSEDFDIASTVPFSSMVQGAPAGADIARGTYNGLADLMRLADPATGITFPDFVAGTMPPVLYVTGHSLGGTLAPAAFAYLHAQVAAARRATAMGLWTFAGLTPGNAGFNAYLASLIDFDFPWRLHNTLDIAPCCWGNLGGLHTIYPPAYHYGVAERLALDAFFAMAAGHDYVQPPGDRALPGTLQAEAEHFEWAKEAAYQHHPATYQQLITAVYAD